MPISVRTLQLNTEGLIKLLGGTPDDRLRFWEILKGLTTPVQAKLLTKQAATLAASLKQAQVDVKGLNKSMKNIG